MHASMFEVACLRDSRTHLIVCELANLVKLYTNCVPNSKRKKGHYGFFLDSADWPV